MARLLKLPFSPRGSGGNEQHTGLYRAKTRPRREAFPEACITPQRSSPSQPPPVWALVKISLDRLASVHEESAGRLSGIQTMIGLVKRKTLRTRVTEHLVNAIVHGDLRPGERLIEGELARRLGVAKSTLREGLQELEHQGLVIKFDNRGTYVTKLSLQEVDDIYDVRMRLEPEAAARACHRMSPKDFSQLASLLDKMHAAGERREYLEALMWDLAFHQRIWKLSASAALERALNAISVPLFAFSGLHLVRLFAGSASAFVQICNDHWALLDALKEGGQEERLRKIFLEKLKVFRVQNIEGARVLEVEQTAERPQDVAAHPEPGF